MATVFDYLPELWDATSLRRELDKARMLVDYLTVSVKESEAPAEVKQKILELAVRYGEWASLAERAIGDGGALEINRFGSDLRDWYDAIGKAGASVDGKYGIDLVMPEIEKRSGAGFFLFALLGVGLFAYAVSRK
jgi:hypothetical protein